MNFLELCQRVFDEGDRAAYHITTTNYKVDEDEQIYKIVNWVKQAYKEIQLWSRYYDFHMKFDDVFLTISEAAGSDYRKSNVRRIERSSLSARRTGTTDEWDLTYLTYEQWRDQFNTIDMAPGVPVWFVELPNKKFRIYPEPDGDYEILADWVTTGDVLENDKDEPIWDEDLHDLIVWVALRYYMTEYETPDELEARIAMSLPPLKNEFYLRYLPDLD